MRIFLIGFMGSGKSTLGRPLASRLGYDFVDLDKAIEQGEGLAIREIFARDGEDRFRELERDYLQRCIDSHENVVVSTGGGSPCFHGNMELMNRSGLTVYFKVDHKMLTDRLAAARQHRPLLADKTTEEIYDFVCRTVECREEHYNKAQVIVSNPSRDINRLIQVLTPCLPSSERH